MEESLNKKLNYKIEFDSDKALSPHDVSSKYSPLALAYIGDSIFDLYIKSHFVLDANMQPEKYHRIVSKIVSANAQERFVDSYFDKLTATGLKTDQLYSVCSRQYFHELSNSNNAGSVNEDIDTDTKEFLKKHPNLVLSEQYYTASGAALKEGICLDPLYLGTGNNKKIRIPLDYGSDMYLIEEK